MERPFNSSSNASNASANAMCFFFSVSSVVCGGVYDAKSCACNVWRRLDRSSSVNNSAADVAGVAGVVVGVSSPKICFVSVSMSAARGACMYFICPDPVMAVSISFLYVEKSVMLPSYPSPLPYDLAIICALRSR